MTVNEMYSLLKTAIENGYGDFKPSVIDDEIGEECTYYVKTIKIDTENKEIVLLTS